MQNLIRAAWPGEGETQGISLDGTESGAVRVRKLAGDRTQIEPAEKSRPKSWVTARKDFTFLIRHKRVPADYRGPIDHYVRAYAEDIFPPMKGEPILVRTDGIQDPDGVLFVHGISETKQRNLLKDLFMAGIDPRQAAGLIPQAVALHRGVELLEGRAFPKFLVILHLGHSGVDLVGIRGGRPVFHRAIYRQTDPGAEQPHAAVSGAVQRHPSARESFEPEAAHPLPFHQQVLLTAQHLEKDPVHFGTPDEVVLTGPWSNQPTILDDVRMFFPKSQVRRLEISKSVVSESMSEEDIRSNAMAIGAAAAGLHRRTAAAVNFLAEPKPAAAANSEGSVYDKIILGGVAAMLALAFVTANAVLLDRTNLRLEKIAQNQAKLETLRARLRGAQSDVAGVDRVLNAAAIRFDSSRSKTFSMPVSMSKLLSVITSAAPPGVTLNKIDYGPGGGADAGRYSNFFSQGDPVTVTLSGAAALPEQALEYQDALREALGVSVEIVSLGREGDLWARKPHRFVIALRGSIRNA